MNGAALLAVAVLSPTGIIRSVGLLGVIAVVFVESGLLVGFFLPGDSLLFTAGFLASGPSGIDASLHLPFVPLVVGCFLAAVAGDQLGFTLGARFGLRIFDRPDGRFFRAAYVDRATAFFDRHGPRTVVLARFVPIVRTFVPVIAGAGRMQRRTFLVYNVIGGAAWAFGIVTLGYFLGQIDAVASHLELAILAVVALSLSPVVIEAVRSRRRSGAGGGR